MGFWANALRNGRRTLKSLIPSFWLLGILASCTQTPTGIEGPAGSRTGSLVVRTLAGNLLGQQSGTTSRFLGIPYAEPPVGELRWRLPLPHRPWTGLRDATNFGSTCPQPASTPGQPPSSEDCLFLNVYAPRLARPERRPVMVWVHGGTNTTGAGSFYDPTPLVEAGDVVVVTINYRLGALGFLAHPALQAESGTTGNYGLVDQQLALRWVRANIAGFGGDPADVTLFGESSGGMNVLSQLVSPDAADLFDKAIIESGTFLLDTPDLATSEAQGEAFATQLGCAAHTADCLRRQPVASILDGQGSPDGTAVAYELAMVDGKVLPLSQRAALGSGRFHRRPMLLGNNAQEGNLFVSPTLTAAEYPGTLAGYAVSAHRPVKAVLDAYPLGAYATPAAGASAAFGDSAFACTDRVAERLLGRHVPTYAYQFDDTAGGTAPLGATHSTELKYLFVVSSVGAVTNGDPASLPAPSRALSLAMRRYWTAFARSGDPARPDLPRWPVATSLHIQSLLAPLPSTDDVLAFDAEHKCRVWNGPDLLGRTDPPVPPSVPVSR